MFKENYFRQTSKHDLNITFKKKNDGDSIHALFVERVLLQLMLTSPSLNAYFHFIEGKLRLKNVKPRRNESCSNDFQQLSDTTKALSSLFLYDLPVEVPL